jgi:hypothetical protein
MMPPKIINEKINRARLFGFLNPKGKARKK